MKNPVKSSNTRGERRVVTTLLNNNINYIAQHRFPDCKNKAPLVFDFYIPDLNMIIEYDGEQHFGPVRFYASMTQKQAEERFEENKLHDKIKNDYCASNGIQMVRISYLEEENIPSIIRNALTLAKEACTTDL